MLGTRSLLLVLPALASLLLSSSCSDSADEARQPSPAAVLSSSVSKVVVEIDYQSGAAPYVGEAGRLADVWQITRGNVERMFAASKKSVTLPTTLSTMRDIGPTTSSTYTNSAITALADRYRQQKSSGSTATFYVLFLDGIYASEEGPQEEVLGVSLGGTGVVALFKPVIAQGGRENLAKIVEQTTLVHELGHAFGLVNDGVAATTPHQDTAHGHHCTNDRCVMSWSNERLGTALVLSRQLALSGGTVLLDDACLADLDAAQTR